jgi:hypothetical protein
MEMKREMEMERERETERGWDGDREREQREQAERAARTGRERGADEANHWDEAPDARQPERTDVDFHARQQAALARAEQLRDRRLQRRAEREAAEAAEHQAEAAEAQAWALVEGLEREARQALLAETPPRDYEVEAKPLRMTSQRLPERCGSSSSRSSRASTSTLSDTGAPAVPTVQTPRSTISQSLQ